MWPTAELHLHVEGTLETELLVDLARRNGISLPSYDPDVLRERYVFDDLQSFLDVHYDNLSVLRTAEDFYDLASGYLRRAVTANVRRAEIFFDPQTHLANGVPIEAVFEGLGTAVTDARRTLGISADLILCFLRDLGGDAAMEMLDLLVGRFGLEREDAYALMSVGVDFAVTQADIVIDLGDLLILGSAVPNIIALYILRDEIRSAHAYGPTPGSC